MKHLFKISILLLFISSSNLHAQQSITLEQCYTMAKENHPLSKKTELLTTQNKWELQSLDVLKYPRIDLDAQATYQSDVITLPISLPNITIESPDKDQYKATVTASQLIYNGGLIETQKDLKKVQLASQQKEIDIQLHTLKTQINQLYFSILLTEQKLQILLKNSGQLKDKKVEIAKMIASGSTYEKALEPIEIKILELSQTIVEQNAIKLNLFDQLSLVTGQKITSNTMLSVPKQADLNEKPRSEFELFELQKNAIDLQSELQKKQVLPKISAFGTAGYGIPGLNMLDNSFDDFYLAGVKLQWNLFDFNANKKQRLALLSSKDLIDNQQQIFEWSQKNNAQNFQSEIVKYNILLKSDRDIIAYREKMVETASKQLQHDLISTSDYTAEVNKLLEAEINQKVHEIQLALAQANYKITLYE